MTFYEIRHYLLCKPEAEENFPFRLKVAVMKIRTKMCATLSEKDEVVTMNLKRDPYVALILRDIFPAIKAGYHMNKRHWNAVVFDGSIPRGEIERMVDNSYSLVVQGLRKAERRALEIHHGHNMLYPNAQL